MDIKLLTKIILTILTVHFIVVALAFTAPLFCSDISQYTSLSFPSTTIAQMDKLHVSPIMVSRIIQHGVRLQGKMQNRFLFVDNEQKLGVVVDEVTGQVINIIPQICSHSFLEQKDAQEIKERNRRLSPKKSASDV